MAEQTINQTVSTNYGTVIGVLHKGATADEIVAALRNAGLMARLTTRLPEGSLRQLLDIVARVALPEEKALARCYRLTLPPTAQLYNDPVPALMLADLCDQPLLKAWPPLFEFVERLRLAAGLAPALAAELQQWADANAGQVVPAVPAAEIERLRREVRAEQERAASGTAARSWLQVYLEPDLHNRTQERKQPLFRVELVLWLPRTNSPLRLELGDGGAEDKRWTFEELPAVLDGAFARAVSDQLIPELTQLVLEVVAPAEVLRYSFERWQRNNTEETYAMRYPLVVRLRDRLTIPDPTDQALAIEYWQQKWKAFLDDGCRHGFEELEWRAQEELDVYELQDDADLACLGLAAPLAPEQRAVYDVLRDAGIPIALWLRSTNLAPAPPAELPERVKALFQGKPLGDLYREVQRVRRSKTVRNDETHVGNALVLLWDDPNRIPEKYAQQGVFDPQGVQGG